MIELNIIGLIGTILLWGVTLYFIGYNRSKLELEVKYNNHYKELFESKEKLVRAEYSEKYQVNEKNRMKYILDHLHDEDIKMINNEEYIVYMVRRNAVKALDEHEDDKSKMWGYTQYGTIS